MSCICKYRIMHLQIILLLMLDKQIPRLVIVCGRNCRPCLNPDHRAHDRLHHRTIGCRQAAGARHPGKVRHRGNVTLRIVPVFGRCPPPDHLLDSVTTVQKAIIIEQVVDCTNAPGHRFEGLETFIRPGHLSPPHRSVFADIAGIVVANASCVTHRSFLSRVSLYPVPPPAFSDRPCWR